MFRLFSSKAKIIEINPEPKLQVVEQIGRAYEFTEEESIEQMNNFQTIAVTLLDIQKEALAYCTNERYQKRIIESDPKVQRRYPRRKSKLERRRIKINYEGQKFDGDSGKKRKHGLISDSLRRAPNPSVKKKNNRTKKNKNKC